MKRILPILILLAGFGHAQDSRTWTDTKGRTIQGKLVEKDATTANVALPTGKRVALKIATLSDDDKKYLETVKIAGFIRFSPKLVSVASNEGKEKDGKAKKDARKVNVTVTGMGDQQLTIHMIWLGDGYGSGKYGIWKTEDKPVGDGGDFEFSTIYTSDPSKFGKNYRGWVCGLKDDATGKWVKKSASMNAYLAYLKDDEP